MQRDAEVRPRPGVLPEALKRVAGTLLARSGARGKSPQRIWPRWGVRLRKLVPGLLSPESG